LKVNITFGPPGTGKTTAMLERIDEHLRAGIPPGRIAFVSYTRRAVHEARDRAAARFAIDPKEFHWFRTIHSTAYRAMNIQRGEMMGAEDYATVGGMLGIKFGSRRNSADGLVVSDDTGDYMLQLINLARARCIDLRDVWCETDKELDWFRLRQVESTLQQYRADMCKYDFDDLLQLAANERPVLPVQAVIIDEAQDLSNAQWNVAKCVFRGAEHIDIAGDDDQAIYTWSGANVHRFLSIKGTERVLPISYRLPSAIYMLAKQVLQRIAQRHMKQWQPRDERGIVTYLNDEEQVDLRSGEWLLLARNGYMLESYKALCEEQGVAYIINGTSSVKDADVQAIVLWGRKQKGTPLKPEDEAHLQRYTKRTDYDTAWHDALTRIPLTRREYYLSILRQDARLQDKPRITISTIHGAKGGEADNVVLMTDMSARSYEALERYPDNEHRVFYVGATRARRHLYVVQPKTTRGYSL
jgi:superfamily I DNA/RNA helicase